MNLDEKSEKIKEGLKKLGKKYGYRSSPDHPAEYIIDPPTWVDFTGAWEYVLKCKVAHGTNPVIALNVHVHEQYIDVFICPPPERFNGVDQIKNALDEVESLLKSSK